MGDTPNSQPASPPPQCPVPRICHFHPFLGLPRCTEHRLIRVTVMEIIREERICKLISKLHQVCSANFSILLYSYICSSTPCLPPLFAFLLSACSPTPSFLRPPLSYALASFIPANLLYCYSSYTVLDSIPVHLITCSSSSSYCLSPALVPLLCILFLLVSC